MLAVIKTGGKQYIVAPGQKIKIEKLKTPENQEKIFEDVLLLADGKEIKIGQPSVKNAKVIANVLKQGRGKKITVLKYKPKTRYKVKRGHRQAFSEVEIIKITS